MPINPTGPGRPTNENRVIAANESLLMAAKVSLELQKDFKNVSASIKKLDAFVDKKLLKTLDKLKEDLSLGKKKTKIERDPFSTNKIYYELKNLNIIFTGLVAQFGFIVKEADNYQQLLLKSGTDLRSYLETFGKSINEVPADFKTSLEVALEDFSTGSKGVSKGLFLLAAREKINGGNSLKLIQTLRSTNAVYGGGIQGLDKLSESLYKTSQTYKISSELLVDSLDGLNEQIAGFGLLGLGTEFQSVVSELTGMLPNFSPAINQFVKELTDFSMEGMQKAALLGISEERQRFSENPTLETLLDAIRKASKRTQELSNNLAGGDKFTGVGITSNILGQGALTSVALQKGIEDLKKNNINTALKTTKDFTQSIEGVVKKVTEDVNKTIIESYSLTTQYTKDYLPYLKLIYRTTLTFGTLGGLIDIYRGFGRFIPAVGSWFAGKTGIGKSIAIAAGGIAALGGSVYAIKKLTEVDVSQQKDLNKIIEDNENIKLRQQVEDNRYAVTAQSQILDSLRTITLTKTIQETTGKNTRDTVELLKQVVELLSKTKTNTPATVMPGLDK